MGADIRASSAGRGFTLIELVVTVAIVAILAMLALPVAEVAIQREKERELRLALREIRKGIDAYKQASEAGRIPRNAGDNGYPKNLSVLVEGVDDLYSPHGGQKYYFLRRIPRDPFSRDSQSPSSATWGKRSYQSPPGEPKEGNDVYDVYSLSNGVGLNGVPYKEW